MLKHDRPTCTHRSLLAVLLILAALGTAQAATLQVTYTGQFEAAGADPAGLHNATFAWQALFDDAALRVATNNTNADHFEAVAPVTLILTGTVAGANDGIYYPPTDIIKELVAGFDYYEFTGPFNVGGSELYPGSLQVPAGFTGAISPTNTLTPVNSADVSDFASWFSYDPELTQYTVVNAQVVTLTINAPVANDDSFDATEDTALAAPAPGVLDNDTDADADSLTAVLDATTSNGALTLNADGSFDYVPAADFCGADSFTYHASDGVLDSNVATVSIDVACVTDPATFLVTKSFSDGNTSEVEVTLSCNNGLPLEQSFVISDGHPVNFVLTNYTEGLADCEITETGLADGYTPSYDNGTVVSADSCAYVDLAEGAHTCTITNTADPATFTVYKEWEIDGAVGDAVELSADITIECDSRVIMAINGAPLHSYDDAVTTTVVGDGGSVEATLSTANGPAFCWASEEITQSGVESDDDCGQRSIPAGGSSSCTITNTVFFEGIPALSRGGLAILVLLTLGMGAIGLRRFA